MAKTSKRQKNTDVPNSADTPSLSAKESNENDLHMNMDKTAFRSKK
ncbi:hypothetical protein PM3016_3341 [Paenibacillus mucilaginosus 3016]|uniref:Uncharacterized protein n=2 Tax=Paenibacillus mucilaginosus TaxID=61624 RepID=H6NHW5_9BACL|nr:hypothetical protein [Paenibacillus mucilaginosus]AFC30186.1 hypothetical protein PM3016_3341 [Paenibacillus mucilaginosus 3016]AFH62453.1 hypothetical protein B2K_17295 [Paenibacillus mucilaginosus K02]